MRQRVFTQTVSTSPESVWAYVSDLRNDCEWREEVSGCKLVSGEPGTAPSSYVETISWEGLDAEVTLTVSESEPGSRLVINGQDESYTSTSIWTFEPVAEGSLMRLELLMETRGAAHLVEPFMWGIVTRWFERDLPKLEEYV